MIDDGCQRSKRKKFGNTVALGYQHKEISNRFKIQIVMINIYFYFSPKINRRRRRNRCHMVEGTHEAHEDHGQAIVNSKWFRIKKP